MEHLQGLVLFLLVGLAAGWIAGKLMKGGSFGLVGDLIIGCVGALVGGFLIHLLGVDMPGGKLVGSLLTATLGAVVLLFLLRYIKK